MATHHQEWRNTNGSLRPQQTVMFREEEQGKG